MLENVYEIIFAWDRTGLPRNDPQNIQFWQKTFCSYKREVKIRMAKKSVSFAFFHFIILKAVKITGKLYILFSSSTTK